ncbi:hypothetical protein O9X81_12605 [Agrobacterium salinitolerans]|jgi:hypothetical protein|nr:hypothetical protein [Agrobacterium salinitolerans]
MKLIFTTVKLNSISQTLPRVGNRFSGATDAKRIAADYRCKNNTKKMPIVQSNSVIGKIFLVNAKISSIKPHYSAKDRKNHRLIVQIQQWFYFGIADCVAYDIARAGHIADHMDRDRGYG